MPDPEEQPDPSENIVTLPCKCQACEAEMMTPLACQSCHTLYPQSAELNHFRLFGLPARFDLDPAQLHSKYLALSRSVHPDHFGAASEDVDRLAVKMSAEVNEAYQRLKNPRTRAEYLLVMAGGKSASEDKTVPESLLGEVFMVQEEIEEAQASGDESALKSIREKLQARLEAMTEEAGELTDAMQSDPEKKDTLRKHLNGMKYIENILQKL